MLILRFILSGFLLSAVRYAGIVTERMKYSFLNAQPSAVSFSHPSIGEPGWDFSRRAWSTAGQLRLPRLNGNPTTMHPAQSATKEKEKMFPCLVQIMITSCKKYKYTIPAQSYKKKYKYANPTRRNLRKTT